MLCQSQSRVASFASCRRLGGFTLIELLVVISIIGILAGLVVGLAPIASNKIKESTVRVELQQLVTLIEAYKVKFGVYPPDGISSTVDGLVPIPARNPLFYELSGVYITNATSPDGYFVSRADGDGPDGVATSELQTWFGRDGILNARTYQQRNRLFISDFKESQYAEIFRNRTDPGYVDLELLVVGFATDASGKRGGGFAWPNNRNDHPIPSNRGLNPWRYVSTNPTNNAGSFDLWAELPVGRDQIKIIGNWKENN